MRWAMVSGHANLLTRIAETRVTWKMKDRERERESHIRGKRRYQGSGVREGIRVVRFLFFRRFLNRFQEFQVLAYTYDDRGARLGVFPLTVGFFELLEGIWGEVFLLLY